MADEDLAGLVSTAQQLLSRLTASLEARGDTAAGSALATLRDTGGALTRIAGGTTAQHRPADAAMIVLDVSDLLGYFTTNRLPTGIQRVQAELIFNILGGSTQANATLCCFEEDRDEWVAVDSVRFMEICALSRAGGNAQDPHWMEMLKELRADIRASASLVFPRGAMLVSVGTGWWLPNYFLYVRQAKVTSGIHYVPLIHDLIPMLTPENCDPELVREFIGWFIGVLHHADFFLANSEATRRDLIAYAEKLGHPIALDHTAVVRLDADFREGVTPASRPVGNRFDEPFVLFVSTIEARKNQLGTLEAWTTLIGRYGSKRVPRLVLIGKRGFGSDKVLAKLEGNADLRERVTILSDIEDSELHALYRNCLFTIYPSVYEGWGLPVTESLCHGKVPLIADNSSLPEAGGAAALYFPTGSTTALVTMLERMIFEAGFLAGREELIQTTFKPRTWREIADSAIAILMAWQAQSEPSPDEIPIGCPNTYYPMIRNQSSRVWRGIGTAEIFRRGLNWYRLEDAGCWTKPTGADLVLKLAKPGAARIGIEMICPPRVVARYRIEVVGHEATVTGRINASKWAFVDVPEEAGRDTFTIRIFTTILSSELGWNGDFRRLGVGVRGFFIFDDQAHSRMDFLEAAALGALPDLDHYRDRALDLVDS